MGNHHPRPLRRLDIVCDLCGKRVRDRPAMYEHSNAKHPTVDLPDITWRLLSDHA